MPDGPGPGQQLLRLLRDFLAWITQLFAKNEGELDPEARIDLPTSIIYGEKTLSPNALSGATEPPKHHRDADHGQPLQHSQEWAQQKARFLRLPSLKRKHGPRPDNTLLKKASSAPRVRFALVTEFSKPPAKECPRHPRNLPTIRIEDWSSPQPPRTSPAKIRSTEPPGSQLRPGCSSRLSLTVPLVDGLGHAIDHTHPEVSEKSRATVVENVSHSDSSFLGASKQRSRRGNGHAHDQALLAGITQLLNLSMQDSKTLGMIAHGFSSPIRQWHSTDLQDPGASSLLKPGTDREGRTQKICSFINPAQCYNARDDSIGIQDYTNTQLSGRRPRMPNRISFGQKRSASLPASATATSSLWDEVFQGYATETGEDGQDEKELQLEDVGYGDNVAAVGISAPVGPTTLQPEAAMTLFKEKQGLAPPGRNNSGLQCLLTISSTRDLPPVPFASCSDEVPYPYVFDLDQYLQDSISPTLPASVVPSPSISTPNSSSSNTKGRDSPYTPTPAPKRPSVNILIAPRASGLIYATQDTLSTTPSSVERSRPFETTVVACKYPSLPPIIEEESSSSWSDYSGAPSSCDGDPDLLKTSPGHEWHSDSSESDDYDNGDAMAGNTKSPLLAAPISSIPSSTLIGDNGDVTASFYEDANETGTPTRFYNDDHFEMNKIRASLHHTPVQHDDGNDDSIQEEPIGSQVSLVESYSSGSTLSHHHHPHQWRAKTSSQPHRDQEHKDEHTLPSDDTIKAGLTISSDIKRNASTRITPVQDPATLVYTRRANVGRRLGVNPGSVLGPRNQPKPTQERYRAVTYGETLTIVPSPPRCLNVDGKTSGSVGGFGIAEVGPRSSEAPPVHSIPSVTGRVVPQKF